MANMSYCMCENTSLDLNQVIQAMSENDCLADFLEGMGRDERRGFNRLADLCEQFLELKANLESYDPEPIPE